MRMVDVISRKRDGLEHTPEEIAYIVQGIVDGSIPDYQLAAWCMAVYFQGMTPREARDMAVRMAATGDQVDLSPLPGVKIDKHSTGGVGDKTSLVVAPLVAAAGIPVCKMSGRGLGHTGGTIDKLESIPGFRTELTLDELFAQVKKIGVGLVGQTGNLVPADKRLYALRDVTGTVASIPLIATSIMSKKLAGGADGFVLDVKVGDGAFLKTKEEAEKLAELMVAIGKNADRKTVAVLSNMDQPLGKAVGNALEVREAIATLRGEGPADLEELSLVLGAQMLVLAGAEKEVAVAKAKLQALLDSGDGLRAFGRWIEGQGGDPRIVDDPERLPLAAHVVGVKSPRSGYVAKWATETLGLISMRLGAGRARKEDPIDHSVGLVIEKKLGDWVEAGEEIAKVYARTAAEAENGAAEVLAAVQLAPTPPPKKPLVIGYII
ncbi:MAG TPA: pyrimidine-nucleoside phosphorylase [Firmicutes bacterium]|uniref:Pyrimidine-nucleoside phosphorylase n=2 Tax=Capillibacterium thermochitinicola TaxID=2699427 RepID=A0A8J6I2W5_9FIRM|nr:pyrimidine-nucleoside phosphorylase [Capillibacterium thermochitinicola]HHW11622.1 pyrimidine-nucleoside phosphorylase [Bacillota bacterium]